MLDRTYHFIVNPQAGNGRGRRYWERIAQIMKREPHTVRMTTGPGDGFPQAAAAANEAAAGDVIVAVGGDGTVGEVATGLLRSGRAEDIALGLIAAGTGNDLARALHMPSELADVLDVIRAGKTTRVDAGFAADHCFVNVAGVGFDAAVANAANQSPKFLGGSIPYVLGLLRTLWSYRPVEMELELDGTIYRGRFLLVAMSNGPYFGGGMKIAPQAELADGALDVVMAGDIGRLETLMLLPRIYKGTHVNHPKVKTVQARNIKVRAGDGVYCQVDGELLPVMPSEFSVAGKALSVLVP